MKQPMARMQLRLPPSDIAAVRSAAAAHGITPSEFMRRAIETALGKPLSMPHGRLSPAQERLFSLYSRMLTSFNRCGNLFATAVLRQHDPAPRLQSDLRQIIAELRAERDQLRS